jgi:hypothetical protein
MQKLPGLDRFVVGVAVIAVIVLSMEVAFVALSSSPSNEIVEQDASGNDGVNQVPEDEPWTEPTILPPPSYFDEEGHPFMHDYYQCAPGGTRIYFQNITVTNGTVNTTFEVDERWYCINVYMYVIGPLNSSNPNMWEEYSIKSPTGECSSGGYGYGTSRGGGGDTTYLYHNGPFGTWEFVYTITNGSIIIWIEGYSTTS